MIKFNDRFSYEKDQHCWHLHETYIGKKKGGGEKEHTRTTYHANLRQICEVIIDRSCGDCESLEEIISLLKNAVEMLTKHATDNEQR